MKKFLYAIVCVILSFSCVLCCFGCNEDNSSKDLQHRLTELEQQIKELQANQGTDNTAEISELKQKIAELEAQGEADGAEIAKLEQKIKELQANQGTDNSAEISELKQKIAELEAQREADRANINELEKNIEYYKINRLNCNYGFFNRQVNEFNYSDFDYSMANPDYSYEIGTEENELIFSKLLSGEYDYRDYLDWFAYNLDYVIRYNEEALKCVESIIREGKFTEELRAKYFGLYDKYNPELNTPGMSSVHYKVLFNDDWTVRRLVQYKLINEEEIKQINTAYEPIYDDKGNLINYYLAFSSIVIIVDMGDGKTADCSVDTTYYRTAQTVSAWNGEKQKHEDVTYLSECRILADVNNVYSGGIPIFDCIFVFTEEEGLWDLTNVWAAFREMALTPKLNIYPDKSEQILRFLKFDV